MKFATALLDSREMGEADRLTVAAGSSVSALMENAGRGAASAELVIDAIFGAVDSVLTDIGTPVDVPDEIAPKTFESDPGLWLDALPWPHETPPSPAS